MLGSEEAALVRVEKCLEKGAGRTAVPFLGLGASVDSTGAVLANCLTIEMLSKAFTGAVNVVKGRSGLPLKKTPAYKRVAAKGYAKSLARSYATEPKEVRHCFDAICCIL